MAENKSNDDLKKKGVVHEDEEADSASAPVVPLINLNLGPRKKLLVLSTGGLLCHRVCRKGRSVAPIFSRRPDAAYGSYKVYKRPHCTEFMKFCLQRFEVGIWSSSREWYMNNALDCIMVGLKSKLLFAWDQNECTDSGFSTLENENKPIFLKELQKIWDNKYSVLSMRLGKYSASNTLLIDSDPYKALLNPPNTAVFPTEYKATDVGDDALGPKGELRLYLDGLVDADDVTSYVKGHPFGKPAITPEHSDWVYYNKIICSNRKN